MSYSKDPYNSLHSDTRLSMVSEVFNNIVPVVAALIGWGIVLLVNKK